MGQGGSEVCTCVWVREELRFVRANGFTYSKKGRKFNKNV